MIRPGIRAAIIEELVNRQARLAVSGHEGIGKQTQLLMSLSLISHPHTPKILPTKTHPPSIHPLIPIIAFKTLGGIAAL